MSLPTVPRDLVPVASSLSAFVHFPLPEGSTYDGVPVDKVAWSADYYDGEVTLRASLSRRGVQVTYSPDPVPAWVPRPPASWLALVAEMAGAVGLDSDEPLPVVVVVVVGRAAGPGRAALFADAIAQAEGELGIDYTSITRDGIDRDDLFPVRPVTADELGGAS